MFNKSDNMAKTVNALLSLAGAVAAFTGLIHSLDSGSNLDVTGLKVSAAYVLGAAFLRIIASTYPAGRVRLGPSFIALLITGAAGAVLALLGGSYWTIWATSLLAFAPLAQDLLTPDSDRSADEVSETV